MKNTILFLKIFLTTFLFLLIFSCASERTDEIEETIPEKTIKNVAYGTNAKQVYDIYLPANRNSNTPVILMIHGGAWQAGQKEDLNYSLNLIKSKWKEAAIVNMNYRLASNANNIHHDEIMADINSVIADVIAKKNDYQISTNMGITGESAGGQLAMTYAYKYNTHNNIKCVANYFGPSIISDWDWYSSYNILLGTNVSSLLSVYVGQTWNKSVYDGVSPYWNITANSQPTIIFHGNADPIVPFYQSQWMSGKLTTLGVPNEFHEYPAFHGFSEPQSAEVTTKLVSFFKVHLH